MREFVITDEQIESLLPYMPNIDDLVNGSEFDFCMELTEKMGEYFHHDEPTPTALFLEHIYDEIYYQNHVSK